MPSPRTCTHIKTNGQKCGSPALRHHTHCYFHYQWQRRDQRRIRLGGPAGMNKHSGIELPLLDGPEAILLSIMEIQHGLLDQRIPIKMGTALLYSLQLALQAKISAFGLGHSGSVRECPELDLELEMERARGMRPARDKCSRCPTQETCLSPRGCKKLPKLPPGYRRVGDHLVRDPVPASTEPCHPEPGAPHLPQSADVGSAVERPASLSSVPPISGCSVASQPCHPERSAAVSRGAEGPLVSSPEATTLAPTTTVETSSASLRESSLGREPGVTNRKFPPDGAPHLPQLADVGSAHARPQTGTHEERRTRNEEPTENRERRTPCLSIF